MIATYAVIAPPCKVLHIYPAAFCVHCWPRARSKKERGRNGRGGRARWFAAAGIENNGAPAAVAPPLRCFSTLLCCFLLHRVSHECRCGCAIENTLEASPSRKRCILKKYPLRGTLYDPDGGPRRPKKALTSFLVRGRIGWSNTCRTVFSKN